MQKKMKDIEIIKSVWIGTKYASLGLSLIKDSEVFFREFGGIPGMVKWNPVLTEPDDIEFQDRTLYIPGKGDTGQPIRLFLSDLRGERFEPMANDSQIATIQSLKIENNRLRSQVSHLARQLYDMIGDSRFKRMMMKQKQEFDLMRGFGGSSFNDPIASRPLFGRSFDTPFGSNNDMGGEGDRG